MTTWQVYGARDPLGWYCFEREASVRFEAAFVTSTNHVVQLTAGSNMYDFDVEKMEFAGFPVRRCDNYPIEYWALEYWSDDAWAPFNAYAQNLLFTAMKIGRDRVAIHVDRHGAVTTYDIDLTPGECMQTNRSTGRSRPLRVIGSVPAMVGDDEADDTEDIEDDATMPNEYRCPITQMPMKKPVLLRDGHSYEYEAIRKWLRRKQTSPVTGKTLHDTSMTINHALRKLIRDWPTRPSTQTKPSGCSRDEVREHKRTRATAQ